MVPHLPCILLYVFITADASPWLLHQHGAIIATHTLKQHHNRLQPILQIVNHLSEIAEVILNNKIGTVASLVTLRISIFSSMSWMKPIKMSWETLPSILN